MDAINFITATDTSKEALKSATLLRKISVNVLIEGGAGVGKKTLASQIVSSSPTYIYPKEIENQNVNFMELSGRAIIVPHFERIKNFDYLESALKNNKIRLIATSVEPVENRVYERFFTSKIILPSLAERQGDIYPLMECFLKDAKRTFGLDVDIDLHKLKYDISSNCHSLRLSVLFAYIAKTIDEANLQNLLEMYFEDKIGGKNDYRDLLHIFEVPLLRASSDRFKSQLQMSEKLGLNRNTLRKKLQEYQEELE